MSRKALILFSNVQPHRSHLLCFVWKVQESIRISRKLKKNKKQNMVCKGFEELFKAKLELCVNVGP